MRINKYLASIGIGSRRKIDQLISEGKITVNGSLATMGMQVDPQKDQLMVNQNPVKINPSLALVYLKLYKPPGLVSTTSDPDGKPTIMTLLDEQFAKFRLFPVGRLDLMSEGLMIMTNDGAFAQKITHPKFQVAKEYLVWINGKLTEYDLRSLSRGVRLSDGSKVSALVEVVFREPTKSKLKLTITQGKNHQVRRMMSKVGLMVTRLKRIKLGPISIDDLYEGEVRVLTCQEIEAINSL